jgi:opacity protein-like surface antigen
MMTDSLRASACILAIALAGGPALAADIYRAPEGMGGYKDDPVPYVSWAGYYAGAHAGGEWNHTEFTDFDSSGRIFNQGHINGSGVIGGGQAGYNWQYGHFVFGPEIDLGGLSNSGTASFPAHTLAPKYQTDGGFYGDFTGRLGYDFGPALVYAKGGAAFLNTEDKVFYNTPSTYTKSTTIWGWTAGVGAEYLLTPVWSVKAEYQHFDFSDGTFVPTPVEGGGVKFKGDRVDAVTAGINYHFGRGFEPLK